MDESIFLSTSSHADQRPCVEYKRSRLKASRVILESKPLPDNYRDRIAPKPKRGHKERELDIVGVNGSEFRLIMRQSDLNPLDFSVILAYQLPKTSHQFRLRRYNGKSHQHSNVLEGGPPWSDFHIHQATERYQHAGMREDSFAQPTTRYAEMQTAIDCMIADCGFQLPNTNQHLLF